MVNERGSTILAHCARAPGRGYGAPSAPTWRFNDGSGVGPARACSLIGKKRQLAGDVGERILEIGHGDAQQADALGRGQERADKLDARLTQEIMPGDRRAEAAASGDLAKVRELHLDGDGPAESLRLLAPGPDIIGHGLDARLDFGWL